MATKPTSVSLTDEEKGLLEKYRQKLMRKHGVVSTSRAVAMAIRTALKSNRA